MARRLQLDASSRFVQTAALLQRRDPTVDVRNVCIGQSWSGFLAKVHAYSHAIGEMLRDRTLHPDALVLTVDTDALFNLPALPPAHTTGPAGGSSGGSGGSSSGGGSSGSSSGSSGGGAPSTSASLGAYASQLFDEAIAEQPGVRVLFQAEQWCWSPHRGVGCPRDASGFSCKHSCTAAMFEAYARLPAARTRPPTCPRFLNSGAAVGRARDMQVVYTQWAAPPKTWPGEHSKAGGAGGPLPALSPQHCLPDDQCLAHSMMLGGDGSIGLDVAERFFASAATPVNATLAPADARRVPSFKWPVEGERHCGTATCKASRKLLWRRAPERGGRLVRARADSSAPWSAADAMCRLHPPGPLLVHFNGPLKDDWRDSAAVLSEWLVAALVERVEV